MANFDPGDVGPLTADPVGVLIGWCATETDLPECRAGTHDALVAMMGDDRTGPVSWHQVTGGDAHQVLDDITATVDSGSPAAEQYRRLRAMLREYGGWLVVATAPGRRP